MADDVRTQLESIHAADAEAKTSGSGAAGARAAAERAKRWEPVLAGILADPARPHACPFCGEPAVHASWAVFSTHRLASVDIWCDGCDQRMHCACRLDEVAPDAADSYPPGAVHPTAEMARQISQVGRRRGWW